MRIPLEGVFAANIASPLLVFLPVQPHTDPALVTQALSWTRPSLRVLR